MRNLISKILESNELGTIGRRRLLQGLVALAAASNAADAYASTFQGVSLNHLAIRVTDVERSRDFYQKLLGLPVIHQGQDNCFLGLGKNFLTLFRNQNPGLDHYCIAIDKFSADSVMETLKQQGLNPRRPNGSDRVYFLDPDGIEVQLSSVDHHA